MKVIVIGPRGKMGKLITQVAAERDDMELVAGVAPAGRDYVGQDLGMVALIGRNLGVPVVDDLAAVIDGCDVIIDFSTRENALKVLDLAVKHGRHWYVVRQASAKRNLQDLKKQRRQSRCFMQRTLPSL